MTTRFRVLHQMHRAYTALSRAADRRNRQETSLSAPQQAVLFHLMRQDGQAMADIAADLSMSRSSFSGLIDRMESKHLVQRRQDDGDGRVFKLHIREKGRKLAAAAIPMVQFYNDRMLAPFDSKEQQIIKRFLDHVELESESIFAASPDMAKKETEREETS